MANSPIFALKMRILFILILFESSLAFRKANKYHKYHIEDFCMANETFVYELSPSDIRSVAKIEASQSKFNDAERNCTIILEPPVGYSVSLQFMSFTFSSPDENSIDCETYIQISGNGSMSNKVCAQLTSKSFPTFTSYGNMSIIFHQKNDFNKLRSSLILIATAYKMSPCIGKDSFLCNNGRCIWEGLTCDSIDNCGDLSDEWIKGIPCSEISSQPGTDLQDLELFSPSEVHPFVNEELKNELEFSKLLFDVKRTSGIDEFGKEALYTPVPVISVFRSMTVKPVEFETFRRAHNIPLGAAFALAVFGIFGAIIRFCFNYKHCDETRQRQLIDIASVIGRRSLLRAALMNDTAPPPPPPPPPSYERLVNVPEVQRDGPPEYTAVNITLSGEQAESPPEYTAVDAIQAMEPPENPPDYALVSECVTAVVPFNAHESLSNHCTASTKNSVSCDLPPPPYKP